MPERRVGDEDPRVEFDASAEDVLLGRFSFRGLHSGWCPACRRWSPKLPGRT